MISQEERPNSKSIVNQGHVLRNFRMYAQVRLYVLITFYVLLLIAASHSESYMYFPLTLVALSSVASIEFIIFVKWRSLLHVTDYITQERQQHIQQRHDLIQKNIVQGEEIRELQLILQNTNKVIRVIAFTDTENAIYAIQNGQGPDRIIEIKNDVWSACQCGVQDCLHVRYAQTKHRELISSQSTRRIQAGTLRKMHLSGIRQQR